MCVFFIPMQNTINKCLILKLENNNLPSIKKIINVNNY